MFEIMTFLISIMIITNNTMISIKISFWPGHQHRYQNPIQDAYKKGEPSFGHCKHEEVVGEEKVETYHHGVIIITIIRVS